MADEKKDNPTLELTINVPVIVKPWRLRAVTTKYGDKCIFTVKEGDKELDVMWLPIDFANDLKALGVLEISEWPDTKKPKFTVLKGAPDVVLAKTQAPGDKYPHVSVQLAKEDSGPEMPAASGASASRDRPASPATHTLVDHGTLMDQCVQDGIVQAKRIALGLGVQNTDDPMVAGPLITAAHALSATLFIQRARQS